MQIITNENKIIEWNSNNIFVNCIFYWLSLFLSVTWLPVNSATGSSSTCLLWNLQFSWLLNAFTCIDKGCLHSDAQVSKGSQKQQ